MSDLERAQERIKLLEEAINNLREVVSYLYGSVYDLRKLTDSASGAGGRLITLAFDERLGIPFEKPKGHLSTAQDKLLFLEREIFRLCGDSVTAGEAMDGLHKLRGAITNRYRQ